MTTMDADRQGPDLTSTANPKVKAVSKLRDRRERDRTGLTIVDGAREVRRALARAERGAALDLAEATALLAGRGEELERLSAVAGRVRDAGLLAAGRPGVVTYSPKVFVPVTRLCRDRCHYCTFVTTPGRLRRAGEAPYLPPDEVLDLARSGAIHVETETFSLDEAPEAYRRLHEGTLRGRAVVVP